MTFKISVSKVKRIDNLQVDLSLLRKRFISLYDEKYMNIENSDGRATITFFNGSGPTLGGVIENGMIRLVTMDFTGEWSGTVWNNTIMPVLKKSIGQMEMVLIWECGQAIERITVDDGRMKIKEIDL